MASDSDKTRQSHLKLVKTPSHHTAETSREQAEDLEDLHGTRPTPPFETEQTDETLEHHRPAAGEK